MRGFSQGWLALIISISLIPNSFAETAYPSCAVSCLETALQNSRCASTDLACICSDVALTTQVGVCVGTSCTVKESLITKNITTSSCHAPTRGKRGRFILAIVLYSISTFALILRLISNSTSKYKFWYDDAVVLLLFLSSTAVTVISVFLVHLGLGSDIWTVPFDNITQILKILWISEIVYFVAISLLKISFLLFFLRIFLDKRFRKVVCVLIVLNVLVAISFVVAICTTCRPASYVWNHWDGEHTGKCDNMNALVFANAMINITLDMVTLALPISQIVHLNMCNKKKLTVSLMMSVGIIVTIISILRLTSLIHFASSTNPTRDFFDIALWSAIELDMGVLCVSIPTVRVLLVRIFPRLGHGGVDSHSSSADRFSMAPKVPSSSVRRQSKGPPQGEGIVFEKNYAVEFTDRREGCNSMMSSAQIVEIQAGNSSSTGRGQPAQSLCYPAHAWPLFDTDQPSKI
ncbi:hypothetical protein QTJ16_003102 [Diplocarpon rosae]|uniref:CFEM domain-containing protein n=1 Tax=Diplocarpon rosae TaxID=946125 RepID=A0AAD9WF90_9HELO|nr:hypothetical protein QTJ16_003102 [Diplocarpon rosae]